MKRFLIITFATSVIAMVPLTVSAQQKPVDDTYLTSLYQSLLKKNGEDAYLQQLINKERLRIRKIADGDVNAAVTAESAKEFPAGLIGALERQRSIVSLLQGEIRSRTVELNLLREEERKFYLAPATGSGATGDIRNTRSHGELLARRAIHEERIAANNHVLGTEQQRLDQLQWEELLSRMRTMGNSFSYILVIVVAIIIDRLVRKRLASRVEDRNRRYLASKLVSITVYGIAGVWIVTKLFSEHPGALASLALVGAALAVAMQDVVKDVVAWVIIVQRRLFRVGDRITVGIHTGDVIDIGLLRTTMLEVSAANVPNALERSGKMLHFPNSMLLREPVMDYHTTSDFMNVTMKITVTYESDWKKAEAILQELLTTHALPFTEDARHQERQRMVFFLIGGSAGEPAVHVDLADSGVLFTLSFTVPINRRRGILSDLSRSILDRFGEAGIDLAYSTMRVVRKTGSTDEGSL